MGCWLLKYLRAMKYLLTPAALIASLNIVMTVCVCVSLTPLLTLLQLLCLSLPPRLPPPALRSHWTERAQTARAVEQVAGEARPL